MNQQQQKILNLGCGKKHYSNCINIDVRAEFKPDICANIMNLPFGDDSVDGIVAEDVVEHFTRENAKKFLCECRRVMKKGAVIKIKTPYFETIVDMYRKRILSDYDVMRRIFGGQEYETNFHYHLYNPGTLSVLLEECGFPYTSFIGEEQGRTNFIMEAQKQ